MRHCGRLGTDPTIPDIGILVSTDILAIDQASIDPVFRMTRAENPDLAEPVSHAADCDSFLDMRELKMGNPGYERIFIDDRPRFVTDLCFEIEGFEIQKTRLQSEHTPV